MITKVKENIKLFYRRTTFSLLIPISIGCMICIHLLLNYGPLFALAFAVIPLFLIAAYKVGSSNLHCFFFLFIVNYLVQGINRYIPLRIGILMLTLNLGIFILLILKNHFKPLEWHKARIMPLALWCIWFVYCFLELLNPMAMFEPWAISITSYALFPILSTLFFALFL